MLPPRTRWPNPASRWPPVPPRWLSVRNPAPPAVAAARVGHAQPHPAHDPCRDPMHRGRQCRSGAPVRPCGKASKVSRKKRQCPQRTQMGLGLPQKRGSERPAFATGHENGVPATSPFAFFVFPSCSAASPPDLAEGCPSPAIGNAPCQAAQAARSATVPALPVHPQPKPHAPEQPDQNLRGASGRRGRTPCSVNTALEVSRPIRLNLVMDGSCLGW